MADTNAPVQQPMLTTGADVEVDNDVSHDAKLGQNLGS